MAARDKLTIAPINGVAYDSVVDTRDTPIGVYAELDGVAVAITTAACELKRGSSSVTLTVSVATTGQATTTVSASNLDTIGASMLDGVVAFWSGTVVSGAVTHRWEYEMPLVVGDREFRFPVLYAQLKRKIPQLNASATVPSGQTNLYPQCMDILQECRFDIDMAGGDIKAAYLTNPAEFWQWLYYRLLSGLYEYLAGADNGQSHLSRKAVEYADKASQVFTKLIVTKRTDTSPYGTPGGKKSELLQSAKFWTGPMGGGGWGVL